MNSYYFNLRNIGFAFISLFLLQSCSRNPVTGKKEFMLVSESQEKAMGAQADPGIVANYGLYQDEAMQSFINQKGKEMAAISHRPDLDYKFRILDSPVINAFAVPGGYVYFTRGIMAHFNNEAEFAGVLGHEIGHITARHSAQQMTKQTFGQIGLIGGMILKPELAQFGNELQQGLGLLFLKFGRNAESQSDKLGVEYSTQIGYDSHEMANFFGVLSRLQQQSGQSLPDFMSTHPNPANRFAKVHQMSDEIQKTVNPAQLKVNRESYLKMIDGITYGEDPRQGFVENQNFFHPELKFQFPIPSRWKTVNTPQMVQIGEPNGKALIIMTLSPEKTLTAAANSTIERDQLKVMESGNVNVNGLPGIAMVSEKAGQQQQGTQPLNILTYLIEYNGLIYQFHGLATKVDFNKYLNTMSNTMKNFRVLHDPAILNRQADVISIQTVPSNMTLAQALSRSNTPSDKMETMAILNNMKLTDQIKAGTMIKTLKKGNSATTKSGTTTTGKKKLKKGLK